MTAWDDEKDVEFTRLRLARTPVKDMAAHFGTTVGAVYAHARVLKAFVMDRKTWSIDEVAALLRMDDLDVPIREMARRLDRTDQSVSWKLGDLGRVAKRMRYWKEDDVVLTAMSAAYASPEAIAARLNRSVETVRERLSFLGLRETRARWDDADVDRLKALVADGMTPDAIGVALGREAGSIRAKAYAVGLRFTDVDRVLTVEEVAALRDAMKVRGGLAAFAERIGVSTRWLRTKARAAGVPVQKRRRRPLDAAGEAEIVAAAKAGTTIAMAVRTLGRDSRTLKDVAARAGVSFPARKKAAPKVRMFKVRTWNAMAPEVERKRVAAPVVRRPDREVVERPVAHVSDVVRATVRATTPSPVVRNVAPARRKAAERPVMDRVAMDTAVARFLAARAVTREDLDPVEETVRAIRRKGYAVIRDAESFVVDGRTRLGDTEELVSFALARSIEVPAALRVAA